MNVYTSFCSKEYCNLYVELRASELQFQPKLYMFFIRFMAEAIVIEPMLATHKWFDMFSYFSRLPAASHQETKYWDVFMRWKCEA